MSVQVPKGYKQTEVGVIPEDWLCGFTADIVKKMKAGLSRRLQERDIGIPVLISGNIENDRLSVENLKYWYLDDPQGAKVENYILKEGDILLCFINSLAQIGKPCIFRDIGRPAIYTTNLFRIIINDNATYEFAFYLFSSSYFQEQIQLIAKVAVNQASFTKPDFLKLVIPIPSVNEQQAIAEALSDADALIESLEQLIAKKRQIKQGAMQELLTGQRRLPGFSGEWVIKRLEELADIRSGGTPSTSQPQFWDGDVLWCTPTDITALNGEKYIFETSRKITVAGLKASSAEIIPAGSIVMTSRATIGECAININPITTNQGFKNFVPFDSVDTEFLYYLLSTQRDGFISLCSGSTFLEIGKNQLTTYEVLIPNEKSEQTAIAIILADIDKEIEGVEARLSKARQIKQAMMQELLTGRIRLI